MSSGFTFGDSLIPFSRADKENPTVEITSCADKGNPIVLVTSVATQGNPTVQCSIVMATQFTANEHLNDPGHLSEECLQLHRVERYSGLLLEEINVF